MLTLETFSVQRCVEEKEGIAKPAAMTVSF
jgi:hypothetical protein